MHTSDVMRRLLTGALFAATLVLVHPAALAQGVAPTSPLHNPDGSLAGFATSELSLYFLIPSQWALLEGARTPPVRLTAASSSGGSQQYDLRLVLGPDYAPTAPTVVALRAQDPHALFFPLPMTIEQVTLFLPPALGSVEAELVPDEQGLSSPVALYYRLRFTEEQIGVLRTLARSGLALQGTVTHSYAAPGGVEQTAAPLTVILDEAALEISSAPPSDPTAWLADLLSTMQMSFPGIIDGPYALGAGITVRIANSRVDAALRPNTWQLQAGSSSIQVIPTQAENLAGTIAFDIVELGARIRVDYRSAFAATLDLSFMQLSITQLDVTAVTVNGAPSAFYTSLLRTLMKSSTVKAKLSEALSDELQRRILSETLFTLGDVLP